MQHKDERALGMVVPRLGIAMALPSVVSPHSTRRGGDLCHGVPVATPHSLDPLWESPPAAVAPDFGKKGN